MPILLNARTHVLAISRRLAALPSLSRALLLAALSGAARATAAWLGPCSGPRLPASGCCAAGTCSLACMEKADVGNLWWSKLPCCCSWSPQPRLPWGGGAERLAAHLPLQPGHQAQEEQGAVPRCLF